ncbi:MAG: DUF393 domain-containing protein [Planctomycetota bacterium]
MTTPATTPTLTVLYDPDCPLCVRCWKWFDRQPKLLPVDFVPQGTADAGRRFPALRVGKNEAVEELIVVGGDGKVYRNDRAWIMCLYALREYRPLAFRLSHPALRPLARRAYHVVSHNRQWLSQWFGETGRNVNDQQLADRIERHTAPIDGDCYDPASNTNACAVPQQPQRQTAQPEEVAR